MVTKPSELIKKILRERKIRKKELIVGTGIPASTVFRHLSGKGEPSLDQRAEYAEFFGMTVKEFDRQWQHPESAGVAVGLPERTRVPLYEGVSAVDMRHEFEHPEAMVEVSADIRPTFAVRIRGDCMEPIYENGDVVVFSIPRFEAEGFVNGKDYWIQFTDGQTTFKRVLVDHRDPERLTMFPVNPAHQPWPVHRSHIRQAARAVERKMG